MAKKTTKAQPKQQPKKDLTVDPIYTSREAAKYLGYSYDAFRRMRSEEGGHVYILFGEREKRYQLSDLNAWKAHKREQSIIEQKKIMNVMKAVFCLRPDYVQRQQRKEIINKLKRITKSFYFDLAVVVLLILALIFKLV